MIMSKISNRTPSFERINQNAFEFVSSIQHTYNFEMEKYLSQNTFVWSLITYTTSAFIRSTYDLVSLIQQSLRILP